MLSSDTDSKSKSNESEAEQMQDTTADNMINNFIIAFSRQYQDVKWLL